jgi:hypothetical protein
MARQRGAIAYPVKALAVPRIGPGMRQTEGSRGPSIFIVIAGLDRQSRQPLGWLLS